MHICFLANASSIHTVRWVNALAELGHKVSLISLQSPKENKLNNNIELYELKIKNKLGYYVNYLQLKNLLQKIKPDILNTHYASGYGTLSRLANYSPTLLSVWGSDVYLFPYQNQRNKNILVKNLESADYIASTSKAMAQQTNLFLNGKKTIEITPFGIDLTIFQSNKNNNNKNEIIIGTVKSLEKVYGIDFLINATAKLIGKLRKENNLSIVNKLKLKIIGEGSELNNLVKLSENLGIADVTEFVGSIPNNEVPQYLSEFDIYCALSRSESFGVAILEASACEVPVVVSDVGGLPEVVENGKTGYIVESENIEEITERLYELVLNKELRQLMGSNGRKFVENSYEWKQNILHMESIYRKIVEKNRSGQEFFK